MFSCTANYVAALNCLRTFRGVLELNTLLILIRE